MGGVHCAAFCGTAAPDRMLHQSDRVCAAEVRFPVVSGSDCLRCIDNDTALPFHPPNSSSSPRSDSHGTFRGRFWTPERGRGGRPPPSIWLSARPENEWRCLRRNRRFFQCTPRHKSIFHRHTGQISVAESPARCARNPTTRSSQIPGCTVHPDSYGIPSVSFDFL